MRPGRTSYPRGGRERKEIAAPARGPLAGSREAASGYRPLTSRVVARTIRIKQPNPALQGAGTGDPTTATAVRGAGQPRWPEHFQVLARQLTSSAKSGFVSGRVERATYHRTLCAPFGTSVLEPLLSHTL